MSKGFKIFLIVFVSLVIGYVGLKKIGQCALLYIFTHATQDSISSNAAWIPKSDRIGYLLVRSHYRPTLTGSPITNKLEVILIIKSINNPLYGKRFVWEIPSKYNPDISFLPTEHISFSPDGKQIVFSQRGLPIFIAELKNNSKFRKLTESGFNAEWSPKENIIVYQGIEQKGYFKTDDNKFGTYWKNENRLLSPPKIISGLKIIELLCGEFPRWSPDGSMIIFAVGGRIFHSDKEGKHISYMKLPYENIGQAAFSPDMTKIVFLRYRTDNLRLFDTNLYIADAKTGSLIKEITKPNVVRFDSETLKDPAWSPDGKYISYTFYSGKLYIIKPDGSNLKLLAE